MMSAMYIIVWWFLRFELLFVRVVYWHPKSFVGEDENYVDNGGATPSFVGEGEDYNLGGAGEERPEKEWLILLGDCNRLSLFSSA